MNHSTSATYRHNLSPEAAELLLQFDRRIRELSGVMPSSDALEYVAYKAPGMQLPFVYSDRRKSKFVVRLNMPFEEITRTIDPEGLCERGNAFPTFYDRSRLISHVMIRCDSPGQIEHIITVIRQALNQERPSLTQAESMESALSSEEHTEIARNLNQVYDVAEGIANQIRRAFPPRRDENTGELVRTDAIQCATELLDCICKLQVVIGEDSYENVANDVE